MTSSTLSVQLYSVREALSADPLAAFQRLKDLGFNQVELFGFVDRADEFAALLEQVGLTAPSGHVNLLGEDVDAALSAASRLGVQTAIVPWADPELWTSRSGVEGVADSLNAVVGRAQDAGLKVGYHNHWFEFADVDGVSAFEVFADRLDPAVVLELDTYWSVVGGTDPVKLLGRLGDRVQFLHVKDGPGTRETREQKPAGQGTIDVAGILAAAPHALRVIEFDDYEGDVFEGIRGSIDFLTEKGETL
jgi:sugar phosphate isomerase/epimerase